MIKNSKTLFTLVKEEAKNLRKHATERELRKISNDVNELNPNSFEKCIYGQATGSCFSIRAHDLIVKCAKKCYKVTDYPNHAKIMGRSTIGGKLNGKPNKNSFPSEPLFRWHYSPIETFIAIPSNQTNGNNAKLIKYLRGESRTLNFKP